jgi:hypothetical protein
LRPPSLGDRYFAGFKQDGDVWNAIVIEIMENDGFFPTFKVGSGSPKTQLNVVSSTFRMNVCLSSLPSIVAEASVVST